MRTLGRIGPRPQAQGRGVAMIMKSNHFAGRRTVPGLQSQFYNSMSSHRPNDPLETDA